MLETRLIYGGSVRLRKCLICSLLTISAFESRTAIADLNKITHPAIMEKIDEMILGGGRILLDAPALFESGADTRCDKIIAVISDDKNNIERILLRDKIERSEAQMRIMRQVSDTVLMRRADIIIENNGDAEFLRKQVENAAKALG